MAVPGETQLVWRGRLLDLLEPATANPVTIVQAPCGYGKTIAVKQFAQAARCHDVWLDARSLDGSRLSKLEAVSPPNETVLLVLENFDCADEAVVLQVRDLVPELPPNIRFLLTTRRRLPLPIARWRAQGIVAEVGRDDLRFELDETATALGLTSRESKQLAAVRSIHERCEGWPAGLRLFAGDWQTSQGNHELDSVASAELLDQIIGELPAELQEVLLASSILSGFNANLIRAVTGSPDAGWLIDRANAASLLVTLDDRYDWFRFPRLLAELMRNRLAERGEAALRGLHRRAADWLLENKHPAAVDHLVAAGDGDDALGLLVTELDLPNRDARWRRIEWSTAFPESWVEASSSRMIHVALIHTRNGESEDAARWLDRAEASLEEQPTEHASRGLLMTTRAMLHARHGNADMAGWLGHEALNLIGDPASELFRRRLLAMLAVLHVVRDEPDVAATLCDELDSLRSPEVVRGHILPALRSRVAELRGELSDAELHAEASLRALEPLDLPFHSALTSAHITLSRVRRERNQLDDAETHARSAMEVSRQHAWQPLLVMSWIELAMVRAARAGPEAGLSVLADIRSDLSSGAPSPIADELLSGLGIALHLAADDLDRAERLLPGTHPGRTQHILRARLALSRNQPDEAERVLAGLATSDRRSRLVRSLLDARVAAMRGDEVALEQQLLQAARVGVTEGFCRSFADVAPELVERLRNIAGARNQLRPLAAALARLASPGGQPGPTFSQREHSVLRYLPSELTNREIAAQLDITVNTLKSHLRSIYRKLNVRSRAAAVSALRAR